MINREQRLTERLNSLQSKLGQSITSGINLDTIVQEINSCESQLRTIELLNKVKIINTREAGRREMLKKIVSVGLFSSDLLTNDLKLNKTKIKANPGLYQLHKETPYMYFKIGYDSIISICSNGFEYRTGKKIYSNSSSSEILPFESFEDACNFNNVQLKAISPKKVQKQINSIKKAEAALKLASEKCEEIKKTNESHFLSSEGFFSQQNANIHTLYTNF